MPNTQTITITKEAKNLLEATKSERQGYTECLLASEAIIEKYGRPRHSMGPVQTHDVPLRHPSGHRSFDVEPTAEDWNEAVKLLQANGGNQALAVRAVNDILPNAENIVKAINRISKTMAGGEV